MGLMDREYMNRTPEERQAQNSEYQKHQQRLKEMNSLHAKGNSLTAKEKRRLEDWKIGLRNWVRENHLVQQ